jgi:hypothetical protein
MLARGVSKVSGKLPEISGSSSSPTSRTLRV